MFKFLTVSFFSLFFFNSFTQSIYEDVYTVFQNNCMPCHNTVENTASLNLEGIGSNVAEKMANVYASLYKQTPLNTEAASKNNFIIYPGDPYRSFLYRKIDNMLTASVSLHADEGVVMPKNSSMTDKEVELIRQWILYGAQETGVHFDKSLMEDYYDNGGIESVSNVPAPPAEGEGFQIHLGPFYLEADGEIEYFSKYETLLDSEIEVHKLQTEMGDYSHHYIVYKFTDAFGGIDPNLIPYGMRSGINFDGKEFVSVDQYSNTLSLPEGSAFIWDAGTVMDLNTHYINYSSTKVLKCEVYYNVYTQDLGTANQEMEVALIPNTDIPIPNDDIPITFNYDFALGANIDIYTWGLIAHTHKYGKDFNIYKNNLDGTRGEQIYDAGCSNGIPGCAVEDFDYSHLPIRFYAPFEPINVLYGLEAEATYQNDGPVSVDWGFTSDDEMMIFVVLYVTDTTGVDMGGTNTSINDLYENDEISVFPNPVSHLLNFDISNAEYQSLSIEIFDVSGRIIHTTSMNSSIVLDVKDWTRGLYFYNIKNEGLSIANGKFAVE